MERIEATVTMRSIYQYSAPAFSGWNYEDRYIYTMTAEDGRIFVWKTTAFMTIKTLDPKGWETDSKGRTWAYWKINRGDIIRIKASVKGESEYKGEKQIELTRVSVLERLFQEKTEEEIEAERKAEREAQKQAQIESLRDGDFLWKMPYKQYKEHYSDCETLIDSYEKRDYDVGRITVIIREGRLVPSGVRGRHYSGYKFKFIEDGKECYAGYYAISEETATKRLLREIPNATDIECIKIYHYKAFGEI